MKISVKIRANRDRARMMEGRAEVEREERQGARLKEEERNGGSQR